MLMMSLGPAKVASAQTAPTDAIYINEILVSPNNEQYDGTDWNGEVRWGPTTTSSWNCTIQLPMQ
ncbi:MAG: hypothetical protein CM1200mP32_04710 [Methanobacteriota archaeon]|nr:MAG: hypothetical protein CM1200mP32_04710 [Euryarchaeota archaeon]